MATLNPFELQALRNPQVLQGFEQGADSVPAAAVVDDGDTASLQPFERAALQRADVRAGFDQSTLLQGIGAFLRETRMSAGLTQVDVQRASGVGQAEISRIESGQLERGPGIVQLARIAQGSGYRLRMELVKEVDGSVVDRRLLEL